MKIKEHGIGLFIKRSKNLLFIEIQMIGKLTHNDYKTFLPILKKALKESKGLDINMLVDMKKFKGWELRAAWDDMVFGLKYRNLFDRLAIIGDKKWEEVAIKMFSPLMNGKIKLFKNREKAIRWINK